MITKISGLNTCGTIKDPRRKTQNMQFKNTSNLSYQSGHNDQFVKQKNNALFTSISIVAGSILFTAGYFMLSALTLKLKK